MSSPLDRPALDQLFYTARTYSTWAKRGVSNETLHALIDAVKMAPTSANCQPLRVVFVTTATAKERLRRHLMAGNIKKTMEAPVNAILAYDLTFYEQLPKLFPHTDARSWFAGKPEHIEKTAFRNGSMQAGYFILAARALGLDCGPMSGFDNAGVDTDFLAGTTFKSNILVNLGYGDPAGLLPRHPRPAFDEIATIV